MNFGLVFDINAKDSALEMRREFNHEYLNDSLKTYSNNQVKEVTNNPVIAKQEPIHNQWTANNNQSVINNPQTPNAPMQPFSIDNIVLGQAYEWYIKLQFNYGLFITVKGVEWLLHKGSIITPDAVNRKKYFNIGDPITVIAQEFKEINGERRVVWTMKG